jgi:hypothetical protein
VVSTGHCEHDLRRLGVPALYRLALALRKGLAEYGGLEREDPDLLLR